MPTPEPSISSSFQLEAFKRSVRNCTDVKALQDELIRALDYSHGLKHFAMGLMLNQKDTDYSGVSEKEIFDTRLHD